MINIKTQPIGLRSGFVFGLVAKGYGFALLVISSAGLISLLDKESSPQPITVEQFDTWKREQVSLTSETIRSENELINQRLSWGMIFQGLLFAAMFIGEKPDALEGLLNSANWFLPLIGFLGCFSITIGTWFAHCVINREIEKQSLFSNGGVAFTSKRYAGFLTFMAPHFLLPVLGGLAWAFLSLASGDFLITHGALSGLRIVHFWAAALLLIVFTLWKLWRQLKADKEENRRQLTILKEDFQKKSLLANPKD